MAKYRKFIAIAICASTVVLAGCSPSDSTKPLPNLSMSTKAKAESGRGVFIAFNQPVQSVTWTWNGHSRTTTLPAPSTDVTIPIQIAQSTHFSIIVNHADGPNVSPLEQPITVSGETAPPLTVVTDPGPWQLDVSRNGPFTLAFSAPIENEDEVANDISFAPPISGQLTWLTSTTAQFVPDAPLDFTESEVMTIQGGASGPRGTDGQYLSTESVVRPFVTESDYKIVVHEKLPQTLYLYKDGHLMLKSLCNTGVTGASTPLGTFYIRSKVPKTEMKGTNPDGTKYDDPNIPWVMGLFGNTAIHAYVRAKYGFPQSNECVELPVNVAQKLYQIVQVGTPVDIVQ